MALVRRVRNFSFVALFTAFSTPLHAAEPVAPNGRIELTARARQWLAEHPIIRVAPDPDYQPIESLDENGRLVGISADYLKLLENKVGLRFGIVPVSSWDEAMSKARSRWWAQHLVTIAIFVVDTDNRVVRIVHNRYLQIIWTDNFRDGQTKVEFGSWPDERPSGTEN